ncbi:MAG: putative DNA repair protein [Cycloclasticus sp.]|jgi:ATP-dependent helicase/nuclease subunit B
MYFSDLFQAVKNDAIVITVNQRLARHLSSKLDQAFLDEGAVSWRSPTILSYDSWLSGLWQQRFDALDVGVEASISKTLLSPEQSLAIWERVIRESNDAELLNVSATAKAANKANQLALQWHIKQGPSTDDNLDLSAFNSWQSSYQSLLLKNDWIDQAQLFEVLFHLFERRILEAPKQMVLAGFDVFSTTQKKLWEFLQSQGVELKQYRASIIEAEIQVLSAVDLQTEASFMAQWARETLQDNPAARIGIVVPELQSRRETIEAAFNDTFFPSLTYKLDIPLNKPYNVSLGEPLSNFPAIQQAQRLLSFFNQPLALNELNKLLRSPFIAAGNAEWSKRGRLEFKLRERGVLKLSIKQLHKWLIPSNDEDDLCPSLSLALTEVLTLLQSKPNRASACEWTSLFRRLLTTVGVQGDRELSSVEYQVFQAWDEVLRAFSSLDVVQGLMTFNAATASLNRLVNERVFQIETPDTPIQIMGLMEAAGHTFDALWVCGLHSKSWPPAPHPEAFLPITEQRKQGLVQSSADLQYQLAKQQTQQWAQSAQKVVFSYPLADASAPRQGSPLLDDYPLVETSDVLRVLPGNLLQQRLGGEWLVAMDDQQAPTLNAQGISRGGVSIIKDQAACPFKAFAHKRLLARSLEEPEPGIDARLRGSLVHAALEGVWKQIKTQQNLLALTIQDRCELVDSVIAEVISHQSQFTPILRRTLGQLESQRISQLLMDWLSIDSEREPFEVNDTELKQTLSVGQLQINTSIDRVDTLQDGSTAIIDYKTGKASLASWFGERPEEPQLPLYGVFGGNDVRSISFAQLKKGEAKYIGVSDTAENFSALKDLTKVKGSQLDWAEQMAYWKTTTTKLANDFVSGDARVSPTIKACNYCDLSSLCRINEQHLAEADGDE